MADDRGRRGDRQTKGGTPPDGGTTLAKKVDADDDEIERVEMLGSRRLASHADWVNPTTKRRKAKRESLRTGCRGI